MPILQRTVFLEFYLVDACVCKGVKNASAFRTSADNFLLAISQQRRYNSDQ
jgi:hypothetical protein